MLKELLHFIFEKAGQQTFLIFEKHFLKIEFLEINKLKNSEEFPFYNDNWEKRTRVKVASPGRINLIGEHTDYNGGFVLPTAIDKKIYFELSKNGTKNSCRIYSDTFNSRFDFQLNSFQKQEDSWKNYILGVIDEIQKITVIPQGFDCVIKSDLPIGAGISSSAAMECGMAAGLNALFNLNLSDKQLIFLSQAAENNFVGSKCGIMDQYASVMSKKDHLILLDCSSLEAEYIPANFKSSKILLVNSMISHNLADSEYNIRRKECETGLLKIQQQNPKVNSLRDVNQQILYDQKNVLSEKEYNRILYVLQENERVLMATSAIKDGDIQKFGKLMYQSHYGLKDLYEVSCTELDFLVKLTERKDFVYGSRMMGGGFGGCTINIIEEDKIDGFIREVTETYNKEFQIQPDFIIVSPSEGTVVTKD